MIPSYRWICQVCDASNAPAESCSCCGAPVCISVSEIELAKSKGVAALYAQRRGAHRARANWMARPLWRRMGDVVFGTMFAAGVFLGCLTWIFASSIRYVAVVCAALLLPALWFFPTRDRDESG